MEDDFVTILCAYSGAGTQRSMWFNWFREHQITEDEIGEGNIRVDTVYLGPGNGCMHRYLIRRGVAKRLSLPEWVPNPA